MGIEVAVISTIASLAVGYESNRRQSAQAAKVEKAQKKANRIKTNQEKFEQVRETRQRIRARRLRLAQLASQSEAGGVTGSSGQLGAESVASSKTNSNIGVVNSDNAFTNALQAQSDKISRASSKSAEIEAQTRFKQQVIGGFNNIFG